MNEEQLYESMNGIDEQTLETSEKAKSSNRWKKFTALAACLCLVVTAVIWAVSPRDGKFYYNDAVDIRGEELPCYTEDYLGRFYTKKPLTEEEINALLPEQRTDWMNFTDSWAEFNEKGEILSASLRNYDPEGAYSVSTNFFSRIPEDNLRATDGKAKCSRYQGVEFYIYQWKWKYSSKDTTWLTALTHIRGVWIELEISAPDKNLHEAKARFKELLKCFVDYGRNKPNLEQLSLGYVPEFIDEKLTYEQAMQERDFGKYIPETVPEEFSLERCDRKKNSRRDVLDITWTKVSQASYAYISWTVSYYDPEDSYPSLINADKINPGEDIFQKWDNSKETWAYVRFGDVVIHIVAEEKYHQMFIEELIKIRDRL